MSGSGRAETGAGPRELRSLVGADGGLALALAPLSPFDAPLAEDEVVVAIRAAPVNPSDLAMLLAGADPAALRAEGTQAAPATCRGTVPRAALAAMAARIGRPMPVGNEGAGRVVACGAGEAARALEGRGVALAGGTYATHRRARVGELLVLPEDMPPERGASWLVNPMTALAMVEAMRAEGHRALVHTAAASNLGRMLVAICREDGVGLVNVVRSPAQEQTLRALGAAHVCDTSREDFEDSLRAALDATGATLCFDATGGGTLAGRILLGMEAVALRGAERYSPYGTAVHKQAHLYGKLDGSPLVAPTSLGMRWGIGGWLLPDFLARVDAATVARMRGRVRDGLGSIFASAYRRTVPLAALLDPAVLAEASRHGTGGKLLVDPGL